MVEATGQYILLEMLSKGGWVMLPLLLCSLLSLAIIVERFVWGPRRKRVVPPALKEDIYRLIEGSRLEELVGLCRANNSPLSRIVLAALRKREHPRTEIVEAIEIAGRNEALALQRYVGLLGTIAAISPLLGLLGTVFGMITTFSVINTQGVGNAPALAGGISEALITTATGLTIAIPSLVFYRYFLQMSRRLVLQMETIALQVVDHLIKERDRSSENENIELRKSTPRVL